MGIHTGKNRRLALDSLIDLELQLHRDQQLEPVALRQRDGEIGQKIDATNLQPPGLYLAWLDEIRQRDADLRSDAATTTAGQQTQRFFEVLNLLLILCGLALGAAATASWLLHDKHNHVNIIFFWVTIIGVQVLLLLGWMVAVLPAAWLQKIPGAGALQTALRAMGRIPAGILAWLGTRLSADYRQSIDQTQGELKRLDWLYGDLKLWLLIRLTQVFAIAYNVGAILAFVALSYGSDPTFGWRSTMLRDDHMHKIVRVISLPWSSAWPEAVPTLEQIKYVRDHSKRDRQLLLNPEQRATDIRMWASLWPFLLASLLVYGLIPRLLTWLFSDYQVRRALRTARLDHFDFRRLVSRLRRPLISSQAAKLNDDGDNDGDGAKQQGNTGRAGRCTALGDLAGESYPVLKWAGVDIDQPRLAGLLQQRFGAQVARLDVVGQMDQRSDEQAFARLGDGVAPKEVIVIVEAWEPPVADYIDFIRRLRGILGDGRMIDVLLYHRNNDGGIAIPEASDVEIWQGTLAAMGDPWLAVEPLVTSTQDAGAIGGAE